MPCDAKKRHLQNVKNVKGLTGSVRRSAVQTWIKNKSKLNKPPAERIKLCNVMHEITKRMKILAKSNVHDAEPFTGAMHSQTTKVQIFHAKRSQRRRRAAQTAS
ncbi:unnamed protein product [Phytophthora fragariaefolia]|uniref:Unnamed protein product n=1 Tax=Phytophthora fragariaefolia TaxID=1490495 RepID=A0A9W6TL18_9STRA|nr:unnamed protein product [Phytophthora fragariaefolia]